MKINELKSKRFLTVKPEIKTISNIFLSSNWMEETLILWVDFIGHPQLKRIKWMK
jgi:NADH-quinone oxidoreductase subunit C